MGKNKIIQRGTLLLVILLIAVMAILTQEDEDPCANPQADISGAILADEPGDQDALANRAILQRGNCKPDAPVEPLSLSTPVPEAPKIVEVETADDILQYRCMVCHGCYDAPCQLKMEAHRGIVRGASKELVYDGTRLRTAGLTRLFDDAQTAQEWRDKGFYPVTDEKQAERGVMYRMLELKQAHPLPSDGLVPEGFDFSLYRDQQCPKQDEFDGFARDYPLWGMPYGFPGLNTTEHKTLTNWLESGSQQPQLSPLSPLQQQTVDNWETFLNGDSLQVRLMSRYLYEHLFLANLYLESSSDPQWFRLVRSKTPPGTDIELVVTRRPYDDPGIDRVFYRVQRMPVVALAKTHMPYRFDATRMDWYRQLFLEEDAEIKALPGYEPEIASNPFKSFVDIPVQSRYRFLLEEAQFSIMNFIKGPVCRGQIALSVIDDHFWVMFANPDLIDPVDYAQFLAREMDNLRMPKPKTGTVIDLFSWRSYAKSHEKYQKARSRYLRKMLDQGKQLNLDSIWDGDGRNDNAALTIFRHFDTASVVRGFVGDTPKTAWVIDYPLLERIHYLLAAGFDVYGAVSHQLESRLFMDFLRLEGEFNFLLFMPADKRLDIHNYWYRGADSKRMRDHFLKRNALAERANSLSYKTDDPKTEFLQWMGQRVHGADAERYDYDNSNTDAAHRKALTKLEKNYGAHNSYLPNVSFINVLSDKSDEVYTLLLNAAHSNIAQLFKEEERRLPQEDSVTVARGFIGAYPNYFFQVNESELDQFVADIAQLKSELDVAVLKERYGVRRNVPWFWRLSDKLHARYREQDPIEYGLFDYNRYSGN